MTPILCVPCRVARGQPHGVVGVQGVAADKSAPNLFVAQSKRLLNICRTVACRPGSAFLQQGCPGERGRKWRPGPVISSPTPGETISLSFSFISAKVNV